MRLLSTSVVALALLSVLVPARVLAAPSFSVSAGPSGTSAFGFTGGWGVSGAFATPIAPVADFIVRADFHHMPDEPAYAVAMPAMIGYARDAESATLMGVFGGLRMHGPDGPLRTHVDAMVGIGHVRDGSFVESRSGLNDGRLETRDDTNLALSFGCGLRTLSAGADVFVEGRYDFYFANGDGVALVPIRFGVTLP